MDLKEIQDIAKNVIHSETKYEIISFHRAAGDVRLGQNHIGYSEVVPYKRWRVVAYGFVVTEAGVSTENPVVQFGLKYGDYMVDTTRYGHITQDVTANKHFSAEDVYIHDPKNLLAAALPLETGGVPVRSPGSGYFDEWHIVTAVLEVTRPNDHTLTVIPFMLLEVEIE